MSDIPKVSLAEGLFNRYRLHTIHQINDDFTKLSNILIPLIPLNLDLAVAIIQWRAGTFQGVSAEH